MRFQGLDLNLLVVLDTLLAELSVSRAATRLHLSQSATSSALARLREHFKDDLLVQTGRQMVATPRALQLGPEVRKILNQVEDKVLTKTRFDPATSNRKFRIMASDYVTIVCLGSALSAISAIAPRLSFEIEPVGNDPAGVMDNGKVDLLIMPEIYVSQTHPFASLFTDSYVCIVDQHNASVGDSITFEQYLDMRHVVVQFAERRKPSFEDWFLERFGTARSIEVVASSYAVVPALVAGTSRIATLHAALARHFHAPYQLRIMPPPLDIPNIREVVQWHTMNANDEGLMWVRDQLLGTAQALGLASGGP